MKRTQIPLYSDTVFAFLASFFFALCLFSYLDFALWATIAASSVCAVAFAALCFLYLRGKLETKYLLAKDEAEKNKLMLHLALDAPENNRRLFSKLLKAEEYGVERKNGALLAGDKLIFLLFTMQPVGADEVAKVIKKPFEGNKAIYCNALSPEAEKLAKQFGLEVTEGREVYLRLKAEELLPKTYLCAKPPVRTFGERLRALFSRSLSRPYFVCGAGLLAFSFFTQFRLYYLIAGSALLALALLVRLFGQTAEHRR